LLTKSNELLRAPAPTEVTTARGAKDAAKLWEEGIEADGDGTAPVLAALEQRQPLLDAIVEAALLKHADESERASHAFDSVTFERTRFIAAEAARYIHEAVQAQAPGDTIALEHAALTWAKRLKQDWGIPGFMTATAVLLGPGKHHEDYENEVYEQAVDLLAADPEGYFANDSHVHSRQSASEAKAPPTTASGADAATARPGQRPARSRASGPVPPTSSPAKEQAPESGELMLSMFLPSPVDGKPVEHTDRTTAAYALHTAVHERLGQHTTENPEPGRLPQPLKLGTVYGVDLSTSGDDQTSEDPTVVVWLGPSGTGLLRMSYSRFVEMTGPELLAAVEWRAAQAAELLGAPLSQTWRDAVRSILPPQFPARPTPAELADLLDTIAQGPDGSEERTRHRAEQALGAYTAGQPELALNILATDDHIWVLRNNGSWIQEEAAAADLSWEELETGFGKEAAELKEIAQAANELPPADETLMPADVTVAHHSAHEALAAIRPYSIGLPNTRYEKITILVAQLDKTVPALRRLHGPDGEHLMNRAKTSVIRILEGLATVASKIRLTGLSTRLERTVARLRGQDTDTLPAPRAVRVDRRMQDLAHIERDLERRMADPTTTLDERGELQEQWIINRARWRARYEQLHGQPPGADFLPDNGLIAGAPPIPNLIAAHDLLVKRLSARVVDLRDIDPHTGEESHPYEPTADLFNGVAWAYEQRLIGIVPTGEDPQGPIPAAQLRQAALTVTSHQNASPLTLRRAMSVTAERADRLLHRLEEQQILGPYRADAPRTVLAGPADIDSLLARPATPPALRKPVAEPAHAPAADPAELDEARIRQLVSKIHADQQKRREPSSGAEPAEATAPTPLARKNTRREAEANALATGQTTSLAPSQS
ncbi:DNA translocase FtsK, partial [Streptomyces sp. NPDC055140]